MTATEPTTSIYGDRGDTPRPDLHPRGVNHLAISTADMKAQLTYWGDVLGCPTKALYWMHGVANTFHGFVELAPESYIAFVQHPDNPTRIEWGVSHAGNAGAPVTAGATQHIALHVDTIDELLTMRDRIRSRGVQVLGPIDHGFVQSIYFGGPEGLSLEVTCGSDIDERQWIDPEVQELCGISADEIEALTRPAGYERPPQPVPQPPYDDTIPHMHPGDSYEKIMAVPDDEVWSRFSETTPPVALDEPGNDVDRPAT
jgi:catechol 2,3-dioxygenase-like lactoylglutathione lyase family enzyme